MFEPQRCQTDKEALVQRERTRGSVGAGGPGHCGRSAGPACAAQGCDVARDFTDQTFNDFSLGTYFKLLCHLSSAFLLMRVLIAFCDQKSIGD